MTLIDMMFGNFQTEQGIAISAMGARSARKPKEAGKGSSFIDILNSSMSSSDKSSVKNAGFNREKFHKEVDKTVEKSDNTPMMHSFREAGKYNRRIDKTTVSDRTRANKSIEEGITTQKKSSAAETVSEPDSQANMMQIVAQLLGLEVSELQKLLNEAGISPDSFESLRNISEISADLAQILGLNSNQQKTLEIMLQTAAELLGDSPDTSYDQSVSIKHSAASENTIHDTSSAPSQDIAASSISAQSPLELLSEQIRQKLDEYGIRLEEGEDSVQEDIKALMLPMLEKTAPKVRQAAHVAEQISVEGSEKELSAIGTEEMPKESDVQADKDSEQTTASVRLPQQADSQPAVSNETQNQPVFTSIIQANQAIDATPVKAPVSANAKEILSQIIEKAQIIMMPDKSEMVMELKPDSLGKLSLKLVTENGIVMAKFVAENQQVKEVLETNMQLLKDSLQKQGLDVQGFSVSVRQDSNRSGWNNQREGRTDGFAKDQIATVTSHEGQMPVFSETAGRRNPYMRETSTIELSA